MEFIYDNVTEFADVMKCNSVENDNVAKAVLIIISDGGPDENPRYQNVIGVAIHHFVTRELDAIFIATNAPGRFPLEALYSMGGGFRLNFCRFLF